MTKIIIGTRGSALALAQANQIAGLLKEREIAQDVSLEIIKTSGDRIQDRSLAEIGGKGLFIKEIEEALLDGRVDLAVHSMKDVPGFLAPGLTLTATLPREKPRDMLITQKPEQGISDLSEGAVVGTSSLRRQSQLLAARPDLQVIPLRGNVDTRLRKLKEGVDGLEGILLAEAGLRRLGLEEEVNGFAIPVDTMLPAVGQGALALECRSGDAELRASLNRLDDATTACCVIAERAMMVRLGGSCQVPLAAYAVVEEDGGLWLRGRVCEPSGGIIIRGEIRGSVEDATDLGASLAVTLLRDGGESILLSLGVLPPQVSDA